MALECIMFYKWMICFDILKTFKVRHFLKTFSIFRLASGKVVYIHTHMHTRRYLHAYTYMHVYINRLLTSFWTLREFFLSVNPLQ